MTQPLEEMVAAKVVTYQSPGERLFLFGDPDGDLLLHYDAAAAYDPARVLLVGVEYNVHAQAHLPYFFTGDAAREAYERITAVTSPQDREAPKCIFDLAETVANVEPHLRDVFAEMTRLVLGTQETSEGVAAVCTYDASYAGRKTLPCTIYAPEKSVLFGIYVSGDGFALISKIGECAERFGNELTQEFKDPQRRDVRVSNYLLTFAEQHYSLSQ